MNKRNRYIAFSAFLLATSVAIGAFGAHIITPGLDEKYIRTLSTANQYFIVHALALLALSILMDALTISFLRKMFAIIFLGMIFFSGSLYYIVLSNYFSVGVPTLVGIMTPIGGVTFFAAWFSIGVYFMRR